MTGQELYERWAHRAAPTFELLSPLDAVAWERLARDLDEDKRQAIATAVDRREQR